MASENAILAWAIGGVMVLEAPALILYSSPLLALICFIFSHQLQRFLFLHCTPSNYVVSFVIFILNGVGSDITRGSLGTGIELIRSAGAIYSPFLLFALQKDETRGVEEVERVANGLITVLLPGSLLDTVVRSNEYRTVALAYCSYFLLIGCTVAAAAAADRHNLVAAKTTQAYLAVASYLSLIYVIPTMCPSPYIACFLTIAASLAITGVLHATGLVELETIHRHCLFGRDLNWYVHLPAVLKNILTMSD